jgi:hypothetical protein
LPHELMRARIAAIPKKGAAGDPDNVRPTALLSSFYKIIAALIQTRLANALEHELGHTQFGFRPKRRKAQAIHSLRRVIEYVERGGSKLHLVFIDWSKAFDKVRLSCIYESLQRFGVPEDMFM